MASIERLDTLDRVLDLMISGCGELQEGPRIIDGETADPHSIPKVLAWQVLIKKKEDNGMRWMCGGTIVCPNFVLSAAHCFDNMSPDDVEVYAAEVDRQNPYDHEEHEVKLFHKHPLWVTKPGNGQVATEDMPRDYQYYGLDNDDTEEMDYDYTILELKRPIDLSENSNARAACLPSRSDKDRIFRDGTKFVVNGLGKGSSNKLHHATISWLEKSECGPGLTKQMFCAGGEATGNAKCLGGRGGDYFPFFPLFVRYKIQHILQIKQTIYRNSQA